MSRYAVGKISPRGRPSAREHRDVVGAIKSAAENALNERSPIEITLREIAEAANTTEAMIQYYFGNKDGLFVAMCDDWMEKLPGIFYSQELLDKCVIQKSIFPFIESANEFYLSRPGVVRMLIVELIRGDSAVQKTYARKYLSKRNVLIALFVKHLIDHGVYRKDIDPRLVTISMMSLLIFPISIERTFYAVGAAARQLTDDTWVRMITDMLDRQFRVTDAAE